jgi:hypothetical protein
MSVALHEICHGLFFASRSNPSLDLTRGSFRTPGFTGRYDRTPNRFDQFLKIGTSGSTSLASKCVSYTGFYNDIVGDNLYFHDPAATNPTLFKIYAPDPYEGGSSGSHFATDASVAQDCVVNNIPVNECSALMTPSIANGEASRIIGTNTLRVLSSMLSAQVAPGGKCQFDKFTAPYAEG